MNTFKTAVVVVLMLGTAYGGWKLVNGQWKLVSGRDGSNVLPDSVMWTPAPGSPEAPPFDAENTSLLTAPTVVMADAPEFGATSPASRTDTKTARTRSSGPEGPAVTTGPADPFLSPGELPEVQPPPVGDPPQGPVATGAAGGSLGQTAPDREGYPPDTTGEFGIDSPDGTGELVSYDEPATDGAPGDATSPAFAKAWRTGLRQIAEDQLQDALYTLSAWLGSPDLTPDQADELQGLLDQLAGTVIYSTEHQMEPAYFVRRGETVQDVAAQFHVPWQLLAKINGIAEPYRLSEGQRLKVVKGPFAARVDLHQQQIFLYLRGYYAGRFVFTAGRDLPPQTGNYQVVGKRAQQDWYDAEGNPLPPNHPDHPFGPYAIDLGYQHVIHGASLAGPDRGCISVAPRDAADLYDILAVGSQVIIR